MSRYNTNNPVPSNEVKDFSDNAQIVDEIVHLQQKTTKDRFGNDLKTWYGIQRDANEAIAAFGYITLDSFEDGNTLTLQNQVLRYEATGEYYRWDGTFPKTVPAGSTPDSTGGEGIGAWVGIGDAALRGQLNNSFSDVVSLRNSKNLLPSIPVQLSNYYAGINGGGGQFYVDVDDTTSSEDSGTVFINTSGQRIKRVTDGICRWSDFGILPGMPVAPTKSQCEAVWAWGFANGCTRYETFQQREMPFTFPLLFQVPADWTGGAVSFIAEGLHQFAYDFTNGATDDVVEIILKLEDLSGNTPIHTIYNFDNVGMGRFPGKNIRYTALRHTNASRLPGKTTTDMPCSLAVVIIAPCTIQRFITAMDNCL